MPTPQPLQPTLASSLDRVAEEVTDLVRLGDQLQTVISRLTTAGGPPDATMMIEAQAADLLSQRLSGLAAFVRALAQAAPEDVTADIGAAVRVLTLAEQVRRLSGAPPSTTAPAPPEAAGEPSLFWD